MWDHSRPPGNNGCHNVKLWGRFFTWEHNPISREWHSGPRNFAPLWMVPVPEKFGPWKKYVAVSVKFGTGTGKFPWNLVPVPVNSREFSTFWVVTEKIGPEKNTGSGKIWSRKKVLVPVPEKIGSGKKYRYQQNYGYRRTLISSSINWCFGCKKSAKLTGCYNMRKNLCRFHTLRTAFYCGMILTKKVVIVGPHWPSKWVKWPPPTLLYVKWSNWCIMSLRYT